MHLDLTGSIIVLAALGTVFVAPFLLIVAGILLFVPGVRRYRVARAGGYGAFGLAVMLVLVGSPVLIGVGSTLVSWLLDTTRTRQLQRAETVDGIDFPAGSTVRVDRGVVLGGAVPVPTAMLGRVVIDSFTLSPPGVTPRVIESGTLASPADIGGIPCGAGPLSDGGGTVFCHLGRQFAYRGVTLAAGEPIEIQQSPDGTAPFLRRGTLAIPSPLFGITWPAGTWFEGAGVADGEQLAAFPSELPHVVTLCLAPGHVVTADDFTLHGPMRIAVIQDTMDVMSGCGNGPEPGGYAQVGPTRFPHGKRVAGSSWIWLP